MGELIVVVSLTEEELRTLLVEPDEHLFDLRASGRAQAKLRAALEQPEVIGPELIERVARAVAEDDERESWGGMYENPEEQRAAGQDPSEMTREEYRRNARVAIEATLSVWAVGLVEK